MKDRIKRLRKSLNLTQQEFADRIGVKRNTIGQYEIGRNEPIDSIISLICREFGVNEEWLRNGTGEMFKAAPSSALDALAEEYHLSASDYVMVEKFVNLKPESREVIFSYLKEVVSAFQSDDISPTEKAIPDNDLSKLSIDEKVDLYRKELEREEKAGEKSEASREDA